MRRTVGLVLTCIGVFLLALSPLVRFYVGPRLIAAPTNIYQKTILRADNATYLDAAKLQLRKGVTLTATNTTRGDVRAADDKLAVWDSFTSIDDTTANTRVEIQTQRAVFDRRDARLYNTRGASVGGDTSVRQSGIGLFWPIGVKKHGYPYFDISTKRAWPMNYQGEDRTQGLRTYRFVQRIPATVTESVQGGFPAKLLGVAKPASLPGYDKKTGNVAVDRIYQATTTVWVDPRTGAPVNQEQKVRQTLRTGDGVERLVVGDLDLKTTDASQKDLVKISKDQATKIALARMTVPVGALILGVILLVVGLVLAVPGRRAILPDRAERTSETAS